MLGDIKHN